MSTIYDVKRNVIYEETQEQVEEREERMRKLRYAMEMRYREIEADKSKRGYCARCGLLLPLSGVCSCGCTEKRKPYVSTTPKRNEVIDHRRGLVKGGYVNPTILKMYDK